MPAADAGQHGRDMPVTDVERLAELPVAPGDSRQPPLEGGDRKLGAAALDLRREIEADRFRIGRRLGETLAAQPGGEHFPVGGIGAPGVVGLRRAGVGLGGLRQARQPAAERAGGGGRAGGPLAAGAGRGGPADTRRRAFRRLGGLRSVSLSAPAAVPGPSGPNFRAFSIASSAGSELMSDKAILSDIAAPRQAGRIPRHNSVTKRRQRFTMPR